MSVSHFNVRVYFQLAYLHYGAVVLCLQVYDYFWVARVVLLVILSFFVLIGLVFMIIGHATQVVHAKAVKSKFA